MLCPVAQRLQHHAALLVHPDYPQAATAPDNWWQLFSDPVLNGLQTQVGQNQNLLASAA